MSRSIHHSLKLLQLEATCRIQENITFEKGKKKSEAAKDKPHQEQVQRRGTNACGASSEKKETN